MDASLLAALAMLTGDPALPQQSMESPVVVAEIQAMPDARFWAIIESTTALEADPDAQMAALRDALMPLDADEILAFRDAFERQMTRAYHWDLWAVDYIAHGGASDDSFDYFRRWLISKGQTTFERVLAAPDSLADILAEDSEGVLELEEIGWVIETAWVEKSGRSLDDIPLSPAWTPPGVEPAGEPFDDSPSALAARFPKTWARFGQSPLG